MRDQLVLHSTQVDGVHDANALEDSLAIEDRAREGHATSSRGRRRYVMDHDRVTFHEQTVHHR